MRHSPQLFILASAVLLSACADSRAPTQTSEGSRSRVVASSLNGSTVHVSPLGAAPSTTPGASPNSPSSGMVYLGGYILPVTKVQAVYWATSPIFSGEPTPGTIGSGAQDHSIVGYFLNHLGGSPYFNINTTYYDTRWWTRSAELSHLHVVLG